MTDELAAFLNARLAEDEAAAKAAMFTPDAGEWTARCREEYDGWWDLTDLDGECVAKMYAQATAARHIARHDPARVLREVAADRKLIAAYENVTAFSDPWIGLDLAVRIRAARFGDHPDYRREWAVSGDPGAPAAHESG